MASPFPKKRSRTLSSSARLLFPKHTEVDRIWSTVASSVSKGPLKEAGVFLTKVAPSPTSVGEEENVSIPSCTWLTMLQPVHVICMYIADVYDLEVVKKASRKSRFRLPAGA